MVVLFGFKGGGNMLEITMLLIVVLIAGYFTGKRIGRIEGLAQGTADAVLIMRQKSFEQGYCILCNGSSAPDEEDGGITTDPSIHNI